MQPFYFTLTLLIASLAFALPVESVEHEFLTPENFGKTTAKGYWSVLHVLPVSFANVGWPRFVEHFSPYCHHCREFAPTWDTLVEDYAGSSVNLAQVDCVVHGGTSIVITKRLCSLV